MNTTTIAILSLGLAIFAAPAALPAAQTTAQSPGKDDTYQHPSAQEIANAKSQGMVWANMTSRVYHKGGEDYGKTKHGKFMTEAEAKKQGLRAAKQSSDAKPTPHKKDQSGLDDSADTHAPTPPKQ